MGNDEFLTLLITGAYNMSPKNLEEDNVEKLVKDKMFSALAEEILRIAENNQDLVKLSKKVSPGFPESFRELGAELTLISPEELKRLRQKDAESFTANEIDMAFSDFCENFCESKDMFKRFTIGSCVDCKAMSFSQFLEDKLEKSGEE
jgi:hypothetical protein